ncbi:hypothetical protein [Ornithinimicrobium sp. CNJ-824]|uniref:hypothetical protein n=1 Tax=Ornithinimicrobium sp. CNJ-824 TaxID=1904966 RepID=UPI001EDA5A71|nr:hypothetical protein [Ornithinimicrobium sp. CNJ-824]
MDEIVAVVGDATPVSTRVEIDQRSAPAAVRWMRTQELTLGDLLRDPDDRTVRLAVYPAVLVREGRRMFTPDLDKPLAEGDTLLLLGKEQDLALVRSTVFHDAAVEYVATGREVPTAWVFRVWQKRVARRAQKRPPGGRGSVAA